MGPVLQVAAMAGVIWAAVRAVLAYRGSRRYGATFWGIAVLIGVLNFVSFWLTSVLIGGDAILGRVVRGQYFVGSHGKLTEVPSWVWFYSWVHAASQLVTFPLMVVGAFVQRENIEDAKGDSVSFRGRGAV